jgi:hypothetical protein
MCVPSRIPAIENNHQSLTPVNKSQAIRKKPASPHEEPNEADERDNEWPDREGLSGQGSESALAHLRDMESRRIDKPEKAH